jgi:hypothetical protein
MQTLVVMASSSNPPGLSGLQAELDLLSMLLDDSLATYPWNPTEPESEACLAALEQAFLLDGFSQSEIQDRSQVLFAQLEHCWLKTELAEKFAAIPHAILDAIVERAKQLLDRPLCLSDRLVHCVRECFPHWVEADWQVLVRPFAYAMRDGVESAMSAARSQVWTELSEIEQARLTLAAAYDVLSEREQQLSSTNEL